MKKPVKNHTLSIFRALSVYKAGAAGVCFAVGVPLPFLQDNKLESWGVNRQWQWLEGDAKRTHVLLHTVRQATNSKLAWVTHDYQTQEDTCVVKTLSKYLIACPISFSCLLDPRCMLRLRSVMPKQIEKLGRNWVNQHCAVPVLYLARCLIDFWRNASAITSSSLTFSLAERLSTTVLRTLDSG